MYKDCSMRRLVTLAGDPKMTNLKLLGVVRRIAHISLNAITWLQARTMRQELSKHEKEKLKQASTSNDQPPKQKTSQKHTIKIGKGRDQVII